MPALIAMKRYPELAAKYIATRAAGKPHKLALAALMRKLIKLANTLVRNDREWESKTA